MVDELGDGGVTNGRAKDELGLVWSDRPYVEKDR